jgi:hypothetical protein
VGRVERGGELGERDLALVFVAVVAGDEKNTRTGPSPLRMQTIGIGIKP